ncbi:hypothetical protein [Nocardia salmonicida]|uniref:hypothetical protein n=1 Tax=Nocardia salmonicida TaxID=53431 RepID=UPI0007A4EA37|nr:hypothetical protein [Nocardia salmonicida]
MIDSDGSAPTRALGYVIDPAEGAGVAWDTGVLAWAAERAGWEYVGTASSAPKDADPIGDLIAAIRAARAHVVIVPGLFHLHGEVPGELLRHARVCDETSGRVHSFDGATTSIPPRHHRPDIARSDEHPDGEERAVALRLWQPTDRWPPP